MKTILSFSLLALAAMAAVIVAAEFVALITTL
jgi:hypothetical protein